MNRMFLPLALAAPLAFAAPGMALADEAPRPQINVMGEGDAAVSPDMAVMTLSVVREAASAREALDANNKAMADVIAAMKEGGVEARDLQTAGLSISPQYVYPNDKNGEEKPRITGYQVANTLTVRVRDMEKVGELLDRSVTLGVNQGGHIAFTNDDPSQALQEARRKAVADAVAKAGTLAEAAGVKLGDVQQISEQSFRHPPMPLKAQAMRMDSAAAAVPVEAGENSYQVQVNMTFGIDQ